MADYHWADKIATAIINKNPDKDTYICAAGITPSGPVHIGNFRDIITSELVVRALKKKGKNAKLLFIWDDYDRLRKVPKGVPEDYSKYIGMPISEIPDPFGDADSYASHFKKDFEDVMEELGIKPIFVSQTEQYEKHVYLEGIKFALQHRKEIARILAEFRTQGMTEEEIENYYPYNVYCSKCKKDTTKIEEYDGENKIIYSCECGNREEIDLSKTGHGKLGWKVDWPMRWKHWQIDFEPGGTDHATPGGSYTVSSKLAREVFNFEPPMFKGYEFVGIKGISKMSSSSGSGITPKELLQIYEPAILRWVFVKSQPKSPITFHFDTELIRQYDEFDRLVLRHFEGKLSPEQERILELSNPTGEEYSKIRVPFRQVASFGQIVQGNLEQLKEIFKRIGEEYDLDSLKVRLEKSQNWVEKYAKDMQIHVREFPNTEYYMKLDEVQKTQIRELHDKMKENWDIDKLTTLIYDIPKKPEMSDEEKKKAQRKFFINVYNLLIDKDTGPRLPTFMIALGQERVSKLLNFE